MANLTHYVDLRYRPDPEVQPHEVMSEAMSRLHIALVNNRDWSIGVSFPQHKLRPLTLGEVLRLHGRKADLEALICSPWAGGTKDHLLISPVSVVPAETKGSWKVVRRQFKTNIDRERRRYCRRFDVSWEEACRKLPDTMTDVADQPYVWMKSHSTGRAFTLHVEHRRIETPEREGGFNTYGLSNGATVPRFD